MKAILITAIVVVVILAVGVPVIYYAVNSGDTPIAAKTIPTGQVVGSVNHVEETDTQTAAAPAEDEEEDISAKEMLAKIQTDSSDAIEVASDKVGYSVQYLVEQHKQQAQQTCQPIVDAAQQKLDDAETEAEAKKRAYEDARDDLDDAIESEDDDAIADARDEVEAAKKAYEDALQTKFDANDELVTARINCVY